MSREKFDMKHGAPRESVPVRVEALRKTYRLEDGGLVNALDGLDLVVEPHEMLVLLGASGCGKTTLLRSIAGLDEPDTGRIELFGGAVFDNDRRHWTPPERRGIGMMFQSYALWPHMTAAANVGYPIRQRGESKNVAKQKAMEMLEMVGVQHLADQYPGQMSGGQRQRIALARALATGGSLVLFDEPLSNVDAKVRERLRLELLSMQRRVGFAGVYVTHDQAEAMALATRIAVMSAGTIVQIGTPREIYEKPTNTYVADFIGGGSRFGGRVSAAHEDGQIVECDLGRFAARTGKKFASDTRVEIVTRPQHWRLHEDEPTGPNVVQGRVERVQFMGTFVEYVLDVKGQQILIHNAETQGFVEDQKVWATIDPTRLWLLEKR